MKGKEVKERPTIPPRRSSALIMNQLLGLRSVSAEPLQITIIFIYLFDNITSETLFLKYQFAKVPSTDLKILARNRLIIGPNKSIT